MKALAPIAAIASLIASPATAQGACLSTAEAEALTQVALPGIIRQTGVVCAGRLPASSLLAQPNGALQAKYDAAADRAWPVARGGLVKLSDPLISPLLDSDYARPLLVTMVAPLIVGRIAIEDCPTIDALVTDLAPLPAANTASVIVTTLRYLRKEKAKGRSVAVPDLPLCSGAR